MKASSSHGFSLVEIVVGSAIFLTVGVGVATAWQAYLKVVNISATRSQAALLTEEAAEALQFLRDGGWTANISGRTLGTQYHLSWNGTAYSLTTTPVPLQGGGYFRTIVFSAVNRDAFDSIVSSGGTLDPDTKRIAITITSPGSPDPIMQTEMLIHDVYNN